MANPTWGELQKAQDNPETIEEAIARIVDEHNEDETAHVQEGGSLYAHAASEIIDHLADSIIADKLRALSVDPRKLNQNMVYNAPPLESIDAYNKTAEGSGASVDLESFGKVALIPGSAVGNRAFMNADNSSSPCSAVKNPFFQAWVADSDDRVSDIGISMSMPCPFDTSVGGFGIEWIKSSDVVRGFYNTYYSSAWHRQVVTLKSGVPLGELWRAEFYYNEKIIKFYINNVLVEIMDISAHFYDFDNDYYISIGAKKQQTYTGSATFFMNLIWGQDL